MKKTAIIIGAGPAGLTAAYTLLKESDIKPIVLECSDKIGGISQTISHNGNCMDLGGHRFFSKDERINKFWQEIMPLQAKPSKDDIILNKEKPLAKNGPDPEKDERVLLIRDRVSRIYYNRHFFDYPITLKPTTFINMGLKSTLSAGFGYIASVLHKRQENSLEDFYINRFGKPLYSMFFENYTEKLWGLHPSKISPDWGAQRVKGLSLSKAVLNTLLKPFKKDGKTETSLIEQFYYPKKGPGQLWECVANDIKDMGGEIHMNKTVTEIVCDGKIAAVKTDDGSIYEGDYFFSSMAIKDLINCMNDVPSDIKEISSALPYRDFMTAGILVSKLSLKNKTDKKTVSNIPPDCWIYVQEPDVKLGRIQIFNNWSPYSVKDLENTVFLGLEYFCNEGDALWNMTDNEFIQFATDELCSIGVIEKDAVLDSVAVKVKKAYPAYFGAYKDFDKVSGYLKTIPNLYCIGRNGQHRYNNMDHSMLTAIKAVGCITQGAEADDIWNVNTEKDYHESK